MRIEINPHSLFNLENICEVLYKLHPSVFDFLIEIEGTFGELIGLIDFRNLTEKERDFLSTNVEEIDYSKEPEEPEKPKDLTKTKDEIKEYKNSCRFHNLRKYIQLDTYEYIPIKISIEVEDPVIGKKVKNLVEALEKTRAPEQFCLNKKELDEDAYFAEGYGLTMNEEQKKKFDDFFCGEDVEGLERLLRKEKLYP